VRNREATIRRVDGVGGLIASIMGRSIVPGAIGKTSTSRETRSGELDEPSKRGVSVEAERAEAQKKTLQGLGPVGLVSLHCDSCGHHQGKAYVAFFQDGSRAGHCPKCGETLRESSWIRYKGPEMVVVDERRITNA